MRQLRYKTKAELIEIIEGPADVHGEGKLLSDVLQGVETYGAWNQTRKKAVRDILLMVADRYHV